MIILEVVLGLIAVLILLGVILDRSVRSERYEGERSDHFDGEKFYNLKNLKETENLHLESGDGFFDLLQDRFFGKNWKREEVKQSIPKNRIEGDAIVATFINHATVLLQTNGLNILTDPVYAERVSPVSFIGPKRYRNPGVAFENLPPIDLVLISHNHYDHMDVSTLQDLQEKFAPKIFVPLGNKKYLAKKKISNVHEMEWWEEGKFREQLKITFVPAQHFSARAISDRDRTLWGGYVLSLPAGDMYFAGDTGYGSWTKEVSKRYPAGFRLALLPIGAFRPRGAFRKVHISPAEAMKLQKEIHAKGALGIHFGTFRLGADGQDEGAEIIRANVQDADSQFHVIQNGEAIKI